jgi:hypothetical protein
MSYIGSKPADAVLETDDIADGVITTSKLADNSVTTAKTSYSDIPHRNLIINGDMSIAQRGTSASSLTSSGYHTVDRFQTSIGTAGTWTQSQSTDVPTGQGFSSSLKMDCTTANASLSAGSNLIFQQRLEGQNLQYLKKGTSNAESLTLSFWVKSNKTGTYITNLYDLSNNRSISKSYTISVADTWEKKTITYDGDITGTFANNNTRSFDVNFWLVAGTTYNSGTLQTSWGSLVQADRAVGQVNLADSTANEWYITGVQLEAGTTASDFEFLPYDVNLQRCLRYYYLQTSGSFKRVCTATAFNSTIIDGTVFFKTTMRTTPTLVITSGTDYYRAVGNGSGDSFDTMLILEGNTNQIGLRNNTQFSGTQGYSYFINTNNASSSVAFDGEL